MRDSDRDVKLTALWALSQIEDGAGVDVAAPALEDRDADVRQMALTVLADVRQSRSRDETISSMGIVYRIEQNRLLIVAVAHSHRRDNVVGHPVHAWRSHTTSACDRHSSRFVFATGPSL